QRFNLRLVNLNGQTQQIDYIDAFQGQINHQMNIPNVTAGMYFLEISNESGNRMVRKVMVK
ncbi:MAG: T9SS type A sorting domain-containing protein, partial [Saprospiraceae bacterium]|nr:T9SS type A sorting domain-containing protein [Saprospiraceae bacterium]